VTERSVVGASEWQKIKPAFASRLYTNVGVSMLEALK